MQHSVLLLPHSHIHGSWLLDQVADHRHLPPWSPAKQTSSCAVCSWVSKYPLDRHIGADIFLAPVNVDLYSLNQRMEGKNLISSVTGQSSTPSRIYQDMRPTMIQRHDSKTGRKPHTILGSQPSLSLAEEVRITITPPVCGTLLPAKWLPSKHFHAITPLLITATQQLESRQAMRSRLNLQRSYPRP